MTSQAIPPSSLRLAGEVFRTALKLGLTSFGGPIAHLGYFERVYVRERRWLSGEQYGGFVSLCQLLPGPTSSQVGFLVGLHRAGWLGALAAWMGFTFPSALLMYGFALLAPSAPGRSMQTILHGLMLTAVVVVAQAVWSMALTLTPDLARRAIALGAGVVVLVQHSAIAQLAALAGGAIAGSLVCRTVSAPNVQLARSPTPSAAWFALGLFAILLVALPILASHSPRSPIALASAFYRSGALVFGGGHVVLPLLQQALVPTGWITDDRFLAGYGFAQAMPGPLFTLAAFLGAASAPTGSTLAWSALALVAIFLPGLLLALAGFSMWAGIARRRFAQAALSGTNGAVVGILAAALYDPVWTTAVRSALDLIIVLVGFVLLQWRRAPPILIATLCVLASFASTTLN